MVNYNVVNLISIIIGVFGLLNAKSTPKSTFKTSKSSSLRWPQEVPWIIQSKLAVWNTTKVPRYWDYRDQRPQCEGYISVFNSWGWGNQLSELLTFFGYAIEFDMKNLLLSGLVRDRFARVFPAFKVIPSYDEVPCQMSQYLQVPLPAKIQFNRTLNMLSKKFAENMNLSLTYRKEILQVFEFNDIIKEVIKRVKSKIEEAHRRKMGLTDVTSTTIVAIHCRRTDYTNHLRFYYSLAVTEYYFYKAMDIMRLKYGPNVAFVVATDELLWAKEKFGYSFDDVYFSNDFYEKVSKEGFIFDFALLSSMDHIITSPGTFSATAAYFVDGDVIVPDCRFRGTYLNPMVALKSHLIPRTFALTDPTFLSISNLTYTR